MRRGTGLEHRPLHNLSHQHNLHLAADIPCDLPLNPPAHPSPRPCDQDPVHAGVEALPDVGAPVGLPGLYLDRDALADDGDEEIRSPPAAERGFLVHGQACQRQLANESFDPVAVLEAAVAVALGWEAERVPASGGQLQQADVGGADWDRFGAEEAARLQGPQEAGSGLGVEGEAGVAGCDGAGRVLVEGAEER
ncbi:MAG: hypothetical protein AB1744_08565, partial [Candidatus Zixiibacteriota bacterium]